MIEKSLYERKKDEEKMMIVETKPAKESRRNLSLDAMV